jgi:hypothetical protein
MTRRQLHGSATTRYAKVSQSQTREQGDTANQAAEIYSVVQSNLVEELEDDGSGMSPYSDQSDETLDYEC